MVSEYCERTSNKNTKGTERRCSPLRMWKVQSSNLGRHCYRYYYTSQLFPHQSAPHCVSSRERVSVSTFLVFRTWRRGVDIEGWLIQPSELLVQPIRPMSDNGQLIRGRRESRPWEGRGCEAVNSTINNGDVHQTFRSRFPPSRISDDTIKYVFIRSTAVSEMCTTNTLKYTDVWQGEKFKLFGEFYKLWSNLNILLL